MSAGVEEDFRDFVTARWAELEPLAYLVTLDPAAARRVTAEALARLGGRWGSLLDEGMPGAAARGAVLTAALAAGNPGATDRGRPRRSAPGRSRGSPAVAAAPSPPGAAPNLLDPLGPPNPLDPLHPAEPPDPAVAAVVAALVDAPPLERALVAASVLWGLDAGEVAFLAGMPPGPVRDAERAVRRRLREAHAAGRRQEGLEPAEWAVERDTASAVDALLATGPDTPDPLALVGEQGRRVRRRSVVLGAGTALGAVAVGAWVVDAVGGGAASAAPLLPLPGDPAWASTRTWPARGRLAGDPEVAALVAAATPGARLLFADDVVGRRVVVAGVPDPGGSGATVVRLWAGRAGVAPEELAPTPLVRDRVTFVDDVVPVVLDGAPRPGDGTPGAGDGAAVLLLARPAVLEAEYSTLARYSGAGEVVRQWAAQRLDGGVGVVRLGRPLPPAFRVRLDGYDGGPLGATPVGLPAGTAGEPVAAGLLDALGPFVAACTGLPVSSVRSRLALEVGVAGDVLVPARAGERVRTGRVAVALTTLPNGAVLRSVRVAGDGRGGIGPLDVETLRALAPGSEGDPVAARLPSFGSTVGRFLVVAPGATRAQLVAAVTDTYPASEVTPLRDGAGVLEVADARRAALYRLVTWDASGRRIASWAQVFRRRDPRDLWPRVR